MVLLIATVLDPSMKADFVRFFYLTVENTEAEAKMRELRQYLKKYYLEYERVVRNNTGPVFVTYEEEVLSPGESSSSGLRGKRRVELAFAQFSSQNSSIRSERSELDIYLDDPRVVVRPTENFNVLAWWKKNSDAYPILSLMARDFLSIPVSTVSSESAFSAAGRILGKNRTSLSLQKLLKR